MDTGTRQRKPGDRQSRSARHLRWSKKHKGWRKKTRCNNEGQVTARASLQGADVGGCRVAKHSSGLEEEHDRFNDGTANARADYPSKDVRGLHLGVVALANDEDLDNKKSSETSVARLQSTCVAEQVLTGTLSKMKDERSTILAKRLPWQASKAQTSERRHGVQEWAGTSTKTSTVLARRLPGRVDKASTSEWDDGETSMAGLGGGL